MKYCQEAYKILRNNSSLLVALLRMMLCTDMPELSETSIKFLEQSLALKLRENQIEAFLNDKFSECLSSIATKIMFAIHVIAN